MLLSLSISNSYLVLLFIGSFLIFSLILPSEIVTKNELTLILVIIGQGDVKHILMLQIKTITSVLKVSTHIITASSIRLAAILAIMSVLTFIIAISLYIYPPSLTYYLLVLPTSKYCLTIVSISLFIHFCKFCRSKSKVFAVLVINPALQEKNNWYILSKHKA